VKIKKTFTDNIKSKFKNLLIKNNLIKKIIVMFNEDLILPKTYGFSKFDNLSMGEVFRDLNKFFVNNKKFHIKKINHNSYLLKKI